MSDREIDTFGIRLPIRIVIIRTPFINIISGCQGIHFGFTVRFKLSVRICNTCEHIFRSKLSVNVYNQSYCLG